MDRLVKATKDCVITNIASGHFKPTPRNAKKHSAHQIALLAESILQFGFTQPLIVDEDCNIIAGHARYAAARSLGLPEILAIKVCYLSPWEKRALALADNKLAELAEWDPQILSEELSQLFEPQVDFDFDPRIMGFETVEVDQLLAPPKDRGRDPADRIEPLRERAVSRLGDVWACGEHTIVCGDVFNEETLRILMGSDLADIIFTDAPYNVPNKGHVTKREGVREFAQAHGELSKSEFTDFLHGACRLIATYARPGAVVYMCMDWRHQLELMDAARPVFGEPKNLIVWDKKNAGLGTFYRSQHELILPFVVAGASPINNFKLGGKGRYRTNIWKYPGCSGFGHFREEALDMHPTVKPVAMVADALMDCSNRGDLVLDVFGGSGTTMIAAERTGRIARLAEIDPLYCDTIVVRWQKFTAKPAILAGTRLTFDEIAGERTASVERDESNAR
jgi:DNA modification methylase